MNKITKVIVSILSISASVLFTFYTLYEARNTSSLDFNVFVYITWGLVILGQVIPILIAKNSKDRFDLLVGLLLSFFITCSGIGMQILFVDKDSFDGLVVRMQHWTYVGIVYLLCIFIVYVRLIIQKSLEFKRSFYLTFSDINGCGDIICKHCGHKVEGVIAFIHGNYSCKIGRQCPNCGHFCTEYNMSNHLHRFGDSKENFYCPECGYLIREKDESIHKGEDTILFCPKCKSKNIRFICHYMT